MSKKKTENMFSEETINDAESKASAGSSQNNFLKIEEGENYFRFKGFFATGFEHWLPCGSETKHFGAVDQKGGFNKKDDPIDAYASELFAESRDLKAKGKKGKAKEIKDQANQIKTVLAGYATAIKGRLIETENENEDELVKFVTKKHTGKYGILSLSEARTKNLLELFKDMKAGKIKGFEIEDFSEVTNYIFCAEKGDDRKVTWSVVSKLKKKNKLPEITEEEEKEIEEAEEAIRKLLQPTSKEDAKKYLAEYLNAEDSDSDDDDDEDEEEENKSKKKSSKKKEKSKKSEPEPDDDEDEEDDDEDEEDFLDEDEDE